MNFFSDISGTLLEQYLAGGPVMHVIFVLWMASLTLILLKMYHFWKSRTDLSKLIAAIKVNVSNGEPQKAIEACEKHRGPVGSALKIALQNIHLTEDEMERHYDSAEIYELARLGRHLDLLATITNIAPMIGFFGTVVGMIMSFEVLATQGMNEPKLVAKGISVALLTTAFGLLVAFFTQPFYNRFTEKVKFYRNQLEIARNALLNALCEWRRKAVTETNANR